MSRSWSLTEAQKEKVIQKRIQELTPPDAPERGLNDRPRSVIIGGQPGVGKSTTQRLVRDGLGRTGAASYDGDDNAESHPLYNVIARENRFSGHGIMVQELPDDMHQRCMGHLISGDTKYDVVASHPLGRVEWSEAWVEQFHSEGYHTSVAFVASHDSNSLLGIADRYQTSRDREGYGRWLRPQTHDDFYQKIPDVAHHLESRGLVDSMYVTNRDGQILYENHRGPDGRMQEPLGVRDAINAERSRPPTDLETEHFDSRVAYLEDPQRLGPGQEAEPVHELVRQTVDDAKERNRVHREESQGREAPQISDRSLPEALRDARDRDRDRSPDTISAEATAPESEHPEWRTASERPDRTGSSEESREPGRDGSEPSLGTTESTGSGQRERAEAVGSDSSAGGKEPEQNTFPERGLDPTTGSTESRSQDDVQTRLQRIKEARQGLAGHRSEPERDRAGPDRRRDDPGNERDDPEPER